MYGTINRGIDTSEKNVCTLLILVGQLPLAAARGPFAAKLSQTHFCKKFVIVQPWMINRTIKNSFSETCDL
jgi:hypothetical protein